MAGEKNNKPNSRYNPAAPLSPDLPLRGLRPYCGQALEAMERPDAWMGGP